MIKWIYGIDSAILCLVLIIGVLCLLVSSIMGDINYIKREHKGMVFIIFWLIIKILSILVIDAIILLAIIFSSKYNVFHDKQYNLTIITCIGILILEIYMIFDYIDSIIYIYRGYKAERNKPL